MSLTKGTIYLLQRTLREDHPDSGAHLPQRRQLQRADRPLLPRLHHLPLRQLAARADPHLRGRQPLRGSQKDLRRDPESL